MTNREFAATDKDFRFACDLANVEPTKRQASKFRRDEGLAYKALRYFKNNRFARDEEAIELAKAQLSFAGLRVAA